MDKMNVLILIFDSTSYNHFKRIFPLSFSYLENLKSNFIFKNFNAIGSNSYPNILPLLTGINSVKNNLLNLSSELYDYKHDKEKFEDFRPFIWKDYEKEEFLTMFGEDEAWMGSFNYLANG